MRPLHRLLYPFSDVKNLRLRVGIGVPFDNEGCHAFGKFFDRKRFFSLRCGIQLGDLQPILLLHRREIYQASHLQIRELLASSEELLLVLPLL